MFPTISSLNPFFNGQSVRQLSLLSRYAANSLKSLTAAPKRAPGPYNLFYTEQFPEMKKQFPDFRITEIAARIGAKWQSLSDATKKIYQDRSAKSLAGAQQQREQYKEGLTSRQEMAVRILRLNHRAKRGEIPSRKYLDDNVLEFISNLPKTPFLTGRAVFYSNELRKKDGKSVKEHMAAASSAWNNMSESERNKYEEQSKLDIQNYQNNLKKLIMQND